MWQRVQSIYLSLAFILSIVFLFLPLFDISEKTITAFDVTSVGIVLLLSSCLTVFTFFQYRKRPLQMKLCIAGAIVSMLVCLLSVWHYTQAIPIEGKSKTIQYGTFFPCIMILLFFMAWRSIRKDELLVKSMDRLR